MKLSTLITNYLAYKRALGHRFATEGRVLRSFCRHLDDVAVTDVTADRAKRFGNARRDITNRRRRA